MSSLSSDCYIKVQQFANTVCRNTYPAVDPGSPKLSQHGKTIIITGAGQGIGKACALGFAKSHPYTLVLVGRDAEKLSITKDDIESINPKISIIVIPTDLDDEQSVDQLLDEVQTFGIPDVLVNAAGQWNSCDEDASRTSANGKAPYNIITRAFLKLVGDAKATIIHVDSTMVIHPGAPSYTISKLALAQLTDNIVAEHSNATSIVLHTGFIDKAIVQAHPEVAPFATDTDELVAGVAVYLASPGAEYLNGRYICANWSVDELEARKAEILSKGLLKYDPKADLGGS